MDATATEPADSAFRPHTDMIVVTVPKASRR